MRALRRALPALTLLLPLLAACGAEEETVLDAGVPDAGEAVDGGEARPDAGSVRAGRVLLSSDTVSFGPVVITSTASATLTITNPNDGPVQVGLSEIAGPDSGRFTRSVNVPADEGLFTLEAGGVATVTVRAAPTEEGPIFAVLALDSCLGACPTPVLLLAEGVLTGVSCASELDFDVANPGTCLTRNLTCVNAGNAQERITAVELDPTSDREFELIEPALPVELRAGASVDFEVRYCPTGVAAHRGELVVSTFLPFETDHPVRLLGRGGGADVSCAPAAVSFGVVGLGATVEAQVVCANRGFEDALLSAAFAGAPADFGVVGEAELTVRPGESGVITLRHAPATAGQRQVTLQIASNDPDSPLIEIPVSSEAISVGPCAASVSPSALEFGLVGVGEERRARVFVTNDGQDTCLVRELAMEATSDAAFRVLPLPPGTAIPAGGSRAVEIAFAPRSAAAASGELVIAFSNPGTTRLGVELAGIGGQTGVVAPSLVTFDAALGCAAPARREVLVRRMLTTSGPVSNVVIESDTPGVFELGSVSVPVVLGFYQSLTVEVLYDPMTAGRHTGQLRIISGGQPTPVIVQLVGEARAGVARIEAFDAPTPRLDVLFVVDDSPGLGRVQAALQEAAGQLLAVAEARGADVHFGVITTDMAAAPRSGRLLGTPAFVTSQSPDLVTELHLRLAPGTGGSETEQGILAAVTALGPSLTAGDNAGFLRPDADLAILFVSNEDDGSPTATPIGEHLAALRGAAGSGRLILGAIVGQPTGSCAGPHGGATAAPRYAQLLGRHEGAVLSSICSDMRLGLRRFAEVAVGGVAFPLAGQPVISTLGVRVNGGVVPRVDAMGRTAWAYDLAQSRLLFRAPGLVGAQVEVAYDAVCLSATCGDSTQDPGEYCDDGNELTTGACVMCMEAVCGDGFVQSGVEDCDDGNLDDSDGCLADCTLPRCGDGILQVGEDCDDGNTVGGDGCPATCRYYQQVGPANQALVELANPTQLTFAGGTAPQDDGLAEVELPFTFRYWDVPTTTVTVSVNGFLSVLPFTPDVSFTNVAIPSAALPNGIIAGWWDDLYWDRNVVGGSSIGYTVQGTAPNRVVVFEWRDIRLAAHRTVAHRRFTFQIALFETTNVIQLRYGLTETAGQVPTAATASAGIEDHDGVRGLEALNCSPNCSGPPRSAQQPAGFPQNTRVTFTP